MELNQFPTWRDEQNIIRLGRIRLCSLSVVCFILFCSLFHLRFDIGSFWLMRNKQINCPYVFLFIVTVALVYMHIEPFFLVVQRSVIRFATLKDRIRIAHISDLHVHYPYPQVTLQRMNMIVERINKENPDLIVVTGDLISDFSKWVNSDIDTIVNSFKKFNVPVYVCFGNHDVSCRGQLIVALTGIGVTCLEQKTVETMVRGNRVYLSGLSPSLVLTQTNEYVQEIKDKFTGNEKAFHILLAHMPDAADAAATTDLFDLQLSGHSHGGQCVLPMNAGTPILPPGCLKYHGCVTSDYSVGSMVLHVSRGIGVTPLPFPLIRFLCPPEFSIITICS